MNDSAAYLNENPVDDNKSGSELSRRDILLMGAASASSLLAVNAAASKAAWVASETTGGDLYVARDFAPLLNKKIDGLSQNQLTQHLKLYQGYVKRPMKLRTN